MSRFVLLDAGPLGLLTHARASAAMLAWLGRLQAARVRVTIPEIADYEIRRELIRADKTRSVARLDAMGDDAGYLPLNTAVMRRAAELWANARRGGRPTAPDPAIDADVILAAQAQLLGDDGHTVTVATGNVEHIQRFVDAREWHEIKP